MRQRSRKAKPEKTPFLVGMKHRVQELFGLGHVLVTEPRAFPGALGKVFKCFLRTLWEARGGGLYACGFVVTFVWLEAVSFFDEIISSNGVVEFFSSQLVEMLFRFTVESLQNTVMAFIWPAFLIEMSPVWGTAILLGLYFIFPRYIKEPITTWLFGDDEETQTPIPGNEGR